MSAIGDISARDALRLRPSQAGFTLIEALVVVAIVGLLAGIISPRLQGVIAGQEFRTARSEMILGVREARALAISSGQAARFQIDPTGKGFRVEKRAAHDLPQAVKLQQVGKSGIVTFYPDGTSNGGQFTLLGRDRRQDFLIFPTTGLLVEMRKQ